MSIDELIRQMAASPAAAGDQAALRAFETAAHRADTDPAENSRVRALAELVDAEIAAYDQGLEALDRGDAVAARTLLLQATAQVGDADGLLAELLAQPAGDGTPVTLQQRAAQARAHRAILRAAYRLQYDNAVSPPRRRSVLHRLVSRPRRQPPVGADDLAQVLMAAMESKDPLTRRHLERISRLVQLLGAQVGMRAERLEAARLGGLFHDIGKLAIPNTVLLKTGALTEEEFTLIQLHVARGVSIVQEMPEFFESAPSMLMGETLKGILHHHERYDGCGYPLGMAGHDIPEVARVIAVADAFDAMSTTRSYRPARTPQQAADELRRGAGTCFDPDMVQAFLEVLHTHAAEIEDLGRTDRPTSSLEPPSDTQRRIRLGRTDD